MSKRILCPKCRNRIDLPDGGSRNAIECPLCKVVLPVITPRRADADMLVGKDFAHYHILEKIGQGAMASVYLVKNLHLGRPAALKLLHTTVVTATDVAAKRFVREAKSAARVEHPNVLSLYHVGQHEGRYFLEMQYADGGTLADLIEEKGQVDARTAARVIRDAAAGIAAAHEQGIIHRDVKPGNIMRMKDGTVKVADFGLARLEDGSTELTADGIILGTPLYMPPEQVAGHEADQLSDMYSLGVTFFEMLTGRVPFDAPTPAAILYMHVYEPLPSIREAAPETPEAVCEIVRRMAQKDPRARYRSFADLVRDLDNVVKGSDEIPAEPKRKTVAAPQADFKMDGVKMFLTMARFAVVSSGSGEAAQAALLTRAQGLGISPPQAAQIIKQAAAEAGIPMRKPEVEAAPRVPQIEDEKAEERRRERLARFYSLTVRLVVLLAIVFAIGVVYRVVQDRREKAREEKKVEKVKKQAAQSKSEATFLIRAARQRELGRDWQGAVEKYRKALEVSDSDAVRNGLAAVEKVIEAQGLEKAEKWDEAEQAYKAALAVIQNKAFVESRLVHLKNRKAYTTARADADAAKKERRWDDAIAALIQARGAVAKTAFVPKLDEEIKEIKKLEQEDEAVAQRMKWLLDTCKERGDPYAALAVVERYLESPSPVHQAARDMLEQRKADVEKEIASTPKPLRVDGKALCRRLKLKSGQETAGILVEDKPTELVCRSLQGGKIKERTFSKSDVESIEEISPDVFSREHASAILKQALEEAKTNHAYRALCLMGHLRVEFGKEITPKSEEEREKIKAALSEARRIAVGFCEAMCPTCVGTGRIPCPKCHGTGQVQARCERCRHPSRLPLCDTCRGSGVRMTGVCKECRGRGKKTCRRCKGKGCTLCNQKGRWVCKQCRGTGKTETKLKCWECQGSGKVNGKLCPVCHGRGKPPCTDCHGTGRKVCPECKGKKVVLRRCDKCDADFTVKCTACRGTGKR